MSEEYVGIGDWGLGPIPNPQFNKLENNYNKQI